MANTTIQLRHSTQTGNTPVSLANGEIAINTQDGKLYYADPSGTIQEISGFPGPSGLDTEVQFNDSGVLGANSRLTFDKTTGTLTANTFVTSGDFGNILAANTIYANSFVANTGFIQFSDGSKQFTANVPDSYARNHANAAFDAANTADSKAVTSGSYANSAFAVANSVAAYSNTVNNTQNNSITIIQGVDSTQNTNITDARNHANAAFIHANAAFDAANTAGDATIGDILALSIALG